MSAVIEETEDVKEEVEASVEESSPDAVEEEVLPEGWTADLDEEQNEEPEPEAAEAAEEPVEEVVEEQVEQPAPKQVPLPHLIKERKKRQELEAELAALRNQAPDAGKTPPETPKPITKRPTREEYSFIEDDYAKAEAEWLEGLVESKVRATQESRDAQRRAQEDEQRRQKLASDWEGYVEKDTEYAELVNEIAEAGEEVQLPPVVVEAIQSEGFHLDKHILQNRHELVPKLQAMTPLQQSIEVGRILSKIESSAKPPPKPKPTSQAPPPIKTATPDRELVEVVESGWKID